MRGLRHPLLLCSLLVFMLGGLLIAGDQWITRTKVPILLAETSTEVVARDGELLRAYPVADGIWRLSVEVNDVDPVFLEMLIRYEDKRFWHHQGVDPWALMRAAGQAVWNGRILSGGSTLTMQVARLLEDGPTGSWNGKLRQIRLALALERRLTKAQILSLYLTHAPYGGNLEGVRAATLAWFGKEPKRLTLAEAALLVALPQSPEGRRPDRLPQRARSARNRVVTRMVAQGVLEGSEGDVARRAPLPNRQRPFPLLAPHVADRVTRAQPYARRIAVTLDFESQKSLERLVRVTARQAGDRLSAALIAIDPRTGEILASVGSAGYEDDGRQGFVDMTQAIRSPGSTLKPLVYGLGFEAGLIHPETFITDAPINFDGYAPQNFDGIFRGDLRIREALQLSLNIPVVKLTRELGPAQIMATMRQAGLKPRLSSGKPGLAISLGGLGLSLQDLVQLYASLAAEGQAAALQVQLPETPQMLPRVLSKVAAWQVMDILKGVAAPEGARNGVLAYKTGTSYGHRDAWALGWDGQHVVGVWLGRPDGTPVPGAFGADLAAPLLFEAFGRLKPEFTPHPPPPPETLIVTAAELPLPLQRFKPRDAAFERSADAPEMIFPPDGAKVALADDGLVIKIRGGTEPFSVLANGQPLVSGVYSPEIEVPHPGRGFSELVVIDGLGHSSRSQIQID